MTRLIYFKLFTAASRIPSADGHDGAFLAAIHIPAATKLVPLSLSLRELILCSARGAHVRY